MSALLAACSEKEMAVQDCDRVFYGQLNSETGVKVYIGQSNMVYWNEGDQISVFSSPVNEKFGFDGQTGDDYGTFSKLDATVTGAAFSRNYAVYPYSSTASSPADGTLTFEVPSVQKYAVDSPGMGASMMVASTSGLDDMELRFRNVCGYLVLKMVGDVSIRKIVLCGNDGEVIAGEATAQVEYLNAPAVSLAAEGGKEIVLDCTPGVALNATTPVQFWIALPETTFEDGFTVSVTTTSEGWCSKSTTKNLTVLRNAIQPMKAFTVSKKDIANQLEIPEESGEIEW